MAPKRTLKFWVLYRTSLAKSLLQLLRWPSTPNLSLEIIWKFEGERKSLLSSQVQKPRVSLHRPVKYILQSSISWAEEEQRAEEGRRRSALSIRLLCRPTAGELFLGAKSPARGWKNVKWIWVQLLRNGVRWTKSEVWTVLHWPLRYSLYITAVWKRLYVQFGPHLHEPSRETLQAEQPHIW